MVRKLICRLLRISSPSKLDLEPFKAGTGSPGSLRYRLGLARHVLHGRPLIYRVTYRGSMNIEHTESLTISHCTGLPDLDGDPVERPRFPVDTSWAK